MSQLLNETKNNETHSMFSQNFIVAAMHVLHAKPIRNYGGVELLIILHNSIKKVYSYKFPNFAYFKVGKG